MRVVLHLLELNTLINAKLSNTKKTTKSNTNVNFAYLCNRLELFGPFRVVASFAAR